MAKKIVIEIHLTAEGDRVVNDVYNDAHLLAWIRYYTREYLLEGLELDFEKVEQLTAEIVEIVS